MWSKLKFLLRYTHRYRWWYSGGIIFLALGLMVVRSLSRVLFFVPGRLVERQLKGEMFRKLSTFGKAYYDANSSGSIISRINNDINGVRMITGFGLLQIGNILFSLSVTPYKMWAMSPTLTCSVLLRLLLFFLSLASVLFSLLRIPIFAW